MSTPPISRSNSSNEIEKPQGAESPPTKTKDKKEEQSPTLTSKPVAKNPIDGVFNPDATAQQQIDDDSSQEEQHTQGDLSQDTQEKPKEKPANTDQSKKIFQSKPKVQVPILKLPGSSTTATLKTRTPASPSSIKALASHRTMSPRAGNAPKPNSGNSPSTSNTNTQGQTPSSAPPARSLPPIPKTPSSQAAPVSTSNVPVSARNATSVASNQKGMPADQLSTKSHQMIEKALTTGHIDPTELGNLLVEVQTAGFTSPTSTFNQGKPLLRGGLLVLNFTTSDGTFYDSINLIEKFLQPWAEKVFNTPECNELRKTVLKNYLPVANQVETAAKGMRPKEMQQSEKVKYLMDPVIKPLITWVCGENENLASSQLPEVWKSLLRGIDDAVVYWLKKINCTNMKEIMSLRSEALIAFISTRGYMIAWGVSVQKYTNEHMIGSEKFNSFSNSYFAHRAGKFVTDIMLSRKELKGDVFESRVRGYIQIMSGRKELVSKAPKENASGRRELLKSKTLQSTKAAPLRSGMVSEQAATTLSPRIREKIEWDKEREIKQKQSSYQRQKFFRDFSKLAKLSTYSMEFYKAFQNHVMAEMSDKAYEKFEKDPIPFCQKYLDKFYKGVLNKERQAAEKSIRDVIATIKKQDIDALAPAAEKVKSYVKPESEIALSPRGKNNTKKISGIQPSVQINTISEERRKQFLGNFNYYSEIHELSEDFLKSFEHLILELSAGEYEKFEADPITFCLAYVEKFYSSHITTSKQSDRERAQLKKSEFVFYLNNVTPESLENLRKSMAASPRINLEFPAYPIEKDEKKTVTAPLSTASTQPLQDSRATPVVSVGLNPVASDAQLEKTKRNSEESTEIVTESESDSNAADAASENTEES